MGIKLFSRLLNRTFFYECNHWSFSCDGKAYICTIVGFNRCLSRKRYFDGWWLFYIFSILLFKNFTCHFYQRWCSWCRTVFICSHWFQLNFHIVITVWVNQLFGDIFHLVEVLTIHSCWESSHWALTLLIKKVNQLILYCSCSTLRDFPPRRNGVNGKGSDSFQF